MDRPNFESWWESEGQYCRAGGGEYEKTFAYNAWVSQSERIRVLREALEKIDAIRNDIIGRQSINWSRHIYPLVAALGEAGYEGLDFEEARAAAIRAGSAKS